MVILFLRFFLLFLNPLIHIEVIMPWPVIFDGITVEDIEEVGADSYPVAVVVDLHQAAVVFYRGQGSLSLHTERPSSKLLTNHIWFFIFVHQTFGRHLFDIFPHKVAV